MSEKFLKITLFLSIFLSCLLLTNWHYDFDFTTGTPFNIRAFVFNMFFAREINLDHFWDSSGVTDLAYSPNGHLYSGYPPGAALVALPFFAAEQVIAYLHVHLLGPMNGVLAWWLESLAFAIPSALALAATTVLLFDFMRRIGVRRLTSLVAAWSLPFTTFVLCYATIIHYQPLSMFWVFLAFWLVLHPSRPLGSRELVGAGFALGMAALTEYVTVLYVLPLAAYLTFVILSESEESLTNASNPVRPGRIGIFPDKLGDPSLSLSLRVRMTLRGGLKRLWPFAIGLLIPLTVLMVYSWQSFGAPWRFSHQFMGTMPVHLTEYVTQSIEDRAELAKRLVPKTLVFGLTPWLSLFGLYFSPLRGLLFHAPLVVLAPFGIIWLWRKHRAEALALLGCITITTLLYSFWKEWWGGASYGPRFLISQLPIYLFFVGSGVETLFQRFKKYHPFLVTCYLLLFTYSFVTANAAALTGLRDVVRQGEAEAPWRLVPLERVQKFIGAIATLDTSKLSPFIFGFRAELPVLSSIPAGLLILGFLVLLLFLETLPFLWYFRIRRQGKGPGS